jgi:hypothetical protein
MRANLDGLISRSVGRGWWKDHVTSLLGQPLDATAYAANPEAQLFSCQTAPGLDDEAIFSPQAARDGAESAAQRAARIDPRKSVVMGRLPATTSLPPPASRQASKRVRHAPTPVQAEEWEFRFSDEAHQAATVIQRVYVARLGRHHAAAKQIQRVARGMVYRMRVARFRADRVEAIIAIQAAIRGALCRRVLILLKMARSFGLALEELAGWELGEMACNLKIAVARRKMEDARRKFTGRISRLLLNIQRHHRGYKGRQRAAARREEVRLQTICCLHLQRLWRGRKCRRALAPIIRTVKRGFACLQALARGAAQRRRYRALLAKRLHAALQIERVYRGLLSRRERDLRAAELRAGAKINAAARGRLARNMVRVWKQARVSAELARLALERVAVRAALDKARQETRRLLWTRAGQRELWFRLETARARRAEFKARRAALLGDPDAQDRLRCEEAHEMFDLDSAGELLLPGDLCGATRELGVALFAPQLAAVAVKDMDGGGDGAVEEEELVLWFIKHHGQRANIAAAEKRRQLAALRRADIFANHALLPALFLTSPAGVCLDGARAGATEAWSDAMKGAAESAAAARQHVLASPAGPYLTKAAAAAERARQRLMASRAGAYLVAAHVAAAKARMRTASAVYKRASVPAEPKGEPAPVSALCSPAADQAGQQQNGLPALALTRVKRTYGRMALPSRTPLRATPAMPESPTLTALLDKKGEAPLLTPAVGPPKIEPVRHHKNETRRIEAFDSEDELALMTEEREQHELEERRVLEGGFVRRSVARLWRAELVAAKALRDVTGLSDRRLARQGCYAVRAKAARDAALAAFRLERPHDRWYHEFYLPAHKLASRKRRYPDQAVRVHVPSPKSAGR